MNLEGIKEEDLVYFGYRVEPYFASNIIITGMLNKHALKEIFDWNTGVRWVQVNYTFFQQKNDLAQLEEELSKSFNEKGITYAESIVRQCLEYGDALMRVSKKNGDMSSSLDTKESLAQGLEEYTLAMQRYTAFYSMAMFEGPVMKFAVDLVKKNSTDKNYEELFDLVTTSIRETAVEREQEDFLKLVATENGEIGDQAETHAKKYGWLAIRFFVGDPWTKEDVISRTKNTNRETASQELQKRLKERKERERRIDEAVSKFTVEDKEKVNLIREIVFLRNQRADFYNESAYHIQPLLKKIAATLDVSYTDLINLSPKEVVASLRESFDYKKHIERRKKNFVVYFKDEDPIILDGDEAVNFITSHPFLTVKSENVSQFPGKIGFKGKVKGIVKIVRENKDLEKVENGDILVTPMTIPNFMPAMEKAIAFVTDEGGITCHAAIVAREMQKPCIIATKIATQVLKDGDIVEVDAEKGIVTILK